MIQVKTQKETDLISAVNEILYRLSKGGISSSPVINGDDVDLKLSFYIDKGDEQILKTHSIKLTKEAYDFYMSIPHFYENILAYDNGAWAKELVDDKTVNHYIDGDNLVVEL